VSVESTAFRHWTLNSYYPIDLVDVSIEKFVYILGKLKPANEPHKAHWDDAVSGGFWALQYSVGFCHFDIRSHTMWVEEMVSSLLSILLNVEVLNFDKISAISILNNAIRQILKVQSAYFSINRLVVLYIMRASWPDAGKFLHLNLLGLRFVPFSWLTTPHFSRSTFVAIKLSS
jgi:hypothetical protein